MPLSPGTHLGSYEVLTAIGAGGMGEVYRARDTKLNRDVALKVLPDAFAQDAERMARFQREAHVLASLNHPNIAAIHGLEDSGETHALVLELVEGPTLADRIAQGPIPIDEALPIAKQIADALEAAHEQGIIHRDLKPANIKLRPDGTVKVLDFGLAKAFEGEQKQADQANSPTLTAAAAQMGVIMGTAAYMSPEQAKGKAVDKRADVWAFGVVLWEMLTGEQLFIGEDVSDVLASVMKTNPAWTALSHDTPQPIRRLLRRCLEKDPNARLRDIADARYEVSDALLAPSTDTVEQSARTESGVVERVTPWVAGLVIGGILVGVAMRSLTRPMSPRLTRLMIATPPNERLDVSGSDLDVAVSPNGEYVVYVGSVEDGGRQLFVRRLDQFEATPIEGLGANPRHPFVSPDGEWVGYYDVANGALKKVSLRDGLAVTICRTPGRLYGASWGADDTIIFATNTSNSTDQGLWRVSAEGGVPEVLTTPDADRGEWAHWWPELLPGGQAVLFTILTQSRSTENAEIALLSLETGAQRVLFSGGSNPRYASSGHIVYGADGTLRAVRFDLERLEVLGGALPVQGQVITKGATGAVDFGIAQNGSLVYAPGQAQARAFAATLVWVDRQGREEPLNVAPGGYYVVNLSPDGRYAAIDMAELGNRDIWVLDLVDETFSRLTFDPADDAYPVWTADGRRVIFSSSRAGMRDLYWKAADGAGVTERLTQSPVHQTARSNARNTTQVVISESAASFNLAVLSLEGELSSTPIIESEFDELNGTLSPDGRWLAYQSDETGQDEICVRPFPLVDDGRWQISTTGGRTPVWDPNGRELFYVAGQQLMAVPVQAELGFAFGTAKALFEWPHFQVNAKNFDVSPDGQRLLMVKQGGTSDAAPGQLNGSGQINVVLNWTEELKARVVAQ